jgi:hypothetical protein
MKLKMLSTLALASIMSLPARGEVAPDKNRNALFVSPLTMMIYSGMMNNAVISIAYEHSLSETGYSLLVPVHAGYREQAGERFAAAGFGLGLRKYFGEAFKGSYLTAQSDYTYSYERGEEYMWNSTDYTSYNKPFEKRDFLSITQLAFGYKWGWKEFTLDLNTGGAFYAQDKEKRTNFIASANFGFPFNAETFGF